MQICSGERKKKIERERGRVREGIINRDVSITHNSSGSKSKGFALFLILYSKIHTHSHTSYQTSEMCTHTINIILS